MNWQQGIRGFVLCLILAVLSVDAIGAELEARLDRTEIAQGEVVQLVLRTDGQGMSNPDLSPLSADFDIINRGQSSRFEIVNGNARSWREWQITLAPKHTGKLTIPAIALGSASSGPIELNVLPASQAARSGKGQPVMLETAISSKEPYVQGKVLYTVRLLTKVPLRQAGLTDPQAGDAIIERLGDDRQSETYRNGQSYRMVERQYAIFPQHSGELKIDGPVLSAQVPDPNQRGSNSRDPFTRFNRLFGNDPFPNAGSMFQQTRPIQLRGENRTLDVKPQPAGTPSPWLPAESVTLNEVWSPNPPEFRVGEPVTRTIAITAQGVTAAQLPDIAPTAVAGLKAYPDKAQVETRPDGDTLIAQKVIKTALVPSKAGDFTLPGMKLSWWDTKTNQMQVAQLPARNFKVLPGIAGEMTQADAAPKRATPTGSEPVLPSQAVVQTEDTTLAAPDAAAVNNDRGLWPWLALGFAFAWLVSMAMWWRARQPSRASELPAGSDKPVHKADATTALRRVEQAFRANDPKSARQALIEWAAAVWSANPPRTLDSLAQRLGRDARCVLSALDRHLYAVRDDEAWDGIGAWRQIAAELRDMKTAHATTGENALPPLYAQ